MTCEYCYGQVKVVDHWGNTWTVECCSCGVRYDVHTDPNKVDYKVDYSKLMTQRWAW